MKLKMKREMQTLGNVKPPTTCKKREDTKMNERRTPLWPPYTKNEERI